MENTRKRAEAEARVWGKANAVQRAAAEADAKIRVNAEVERAKIERAEDKAGDSGGSFPGCFIFLKRVLQKEASNV